ncbi:type IV toxin-antitoxin system AbiEi family antitoxin domain-containing protein [Zobellella denitrificans]
MATKGRGVLPEQFGTAQAGAPPNVCENTLNHALKKLFEQNVFSFDKRRVHDLRGTARTMLGKMGFDDSLAKHCLNQQAGNRVDEIYNRHAYFEERKAAHTKLGEWLAPIVNGSDANGNISFEHADQLMQGLHNLSPRKLDALLKACCSIKAKRLFLWLAGRHQHAWLKHLTPENYALGTGKRLLAKGGKLEPIWQITVPKEM